MNCHEVLHRLKLVTGVDISTRPVRRLGREGKAKKSTSLRAAAEVKRMAFRRSITMFNTVKCTPPFINLDLRSQAHANGAAPRLRVPDWHTRKLYKVEAVPVTSESVTFLCACSFNWNIIYR